MDRLSNHQLASLYHICQQGLLTQDQLWSALGQWLQGSDLTFFRYLQQQNLLDETALEKLQQFVSQSSQPSAAMETSSPISPDLFSNIYLPDPSAGKSYLQSALFSSLGETESEPPAAISEGTETSGTRATPYEFVRVLARGGLGKVSVAHDPQLERDVAIKEVLPSYGHSTRALYRFINEAKVAGRLEHPGIVPIYAMGQRQGKPFYVMRLIRGESLHSAIRELHGGTTSRLYEHLDPSRLRSLLRSLCDACYAMAYTHDQNVIHRDLKPGNLMLGDYGETVVVDWGLAKFMDQVNSTAEDDWDMAELPELDPPSPLSVHQTLEGDVLGTPAYMSPEQAAGSKTIDYRTDIYSLGGCLYTILSNETPYRGDKQDVVAEVLKGQPPKLRQRDASLPRSLQAIYLKAMHRDPAARYQTAAEMATDLERWMDGDAVKAAPDSLPEMFSRWARKNSKLMLLMLLSLVVLSVVLGGAGMMIAAERNQWKTSFEAAERSQLDREDTLAESEKLKWQSLKLQQEAENLQNVLAEVVEFWFLSLPERLPPEFENRDPIREEFGQEAISALAKARFGERQKDPATTSALLRCFNLISNFQRVAGSYDEADETAKIQLQLIDDLEKLAETDDRNFGPRIADSLHHVAMTKVRTEGLSQGIFYLERAVRIANKVESNSVAQSAFRVELGLHMVSMYLQTDQLQDALNELHDIQKYAPKMTLKDRPAVIAKLKAKLSYYEAHLANLGVGENTDSREIASTAILQLNQFMKENPEQINLPLLIAHADLSLVLRRSMSPNDIGEGTRSLSQSLAQLNQYLTQYPAVATQHINARECQWSLRVALAADAFLESDWQSAWDYAAPCRQWFPQSLDSVNTPPRMKTLELKTRLILRFAGPHLHKKEAESHDETRLRALVKVATEDLDDSLFRSLINTLNQESSGGQ